MTVNQPPPTPAAATGAGEEEARGRQQSRRPSGHGEELRQGGQADHSQGGLRRQPHRQPGPGRGQERRSGHPEGGAGGRRLEVQRRRGPGHLLDAGQAWQCRRVAGGVSPVQPQDSEQDQL